MKLTDLEICQKIAEIENLKTSVTSKEKGVAASMYPNECYGWYNPLTNDALCFHLMAKYDISFWQSNGRCCAKQRNPNMSVQRFKSPNKAICLAIIEAHKDK